MPMPTVASKTYLSKSGHFTPYRVRYSQRAVIKTNLQVTLGQLELISRGFIRDLVKKTHILIRNRAPGI